MRTVSVTLAGGVERGLPRGLGRFGDVTEQGADRLLGAIATEAHVAEALLPAIVDVLGEDVATAAVIAAWGKAYWALAGIMIEAERALLEDAA